MDRREDRRDLGFEIQDLHEAAERDYAVSSEGARKPQEALLRSTERQMELWCSPKMLEVREIIREAARVDVTVLVTGETGAGKDVVARGIHHLSSRRRRPFVKVNCAAMPYDLLETELFGHERGAFTGAHQLKIGKFQTAEGGTVFLDEIGDLHPGLQAKLLHVLQDGEFSRVGGKTTLKVDVRMIAATNQDLERAVSKGQFRQDLYYRLNVIHIPVPPLRERVQEIPALVNHFVEIYTKRFSRAFTLSPAVLDDLLRQPYPGNVRELENLVKRMIILGVASVSRTRAATAPPEAALAEGRDAVPSDAPQSLREIVRRASALTERDVILRTLEQTGWNRIRAAKLLKISYRALLYKMKRFELHGGRSPRRTSSEGSPPESDGADV